MMTNMTADCTNKSYKLRKLNTADMFSALRLIGKMHIGDIAESAAKAIGKAENESERAVKIGGAIIEALAKELPSCEDEIIGFVVSITEGVTEAELRDNATLFARIIKELACSKELRDFFRAVKG